MMGDESTYDVQIVVQGRVSGEHPGSSLSEVTALLESHLKLWFSSPRAPLRLEFGETVITVRFASKTAGTSRGLKPSSEHPLNTDDAVTEESAQSFPASDPPSWSPSSSTPKAESGPP